MIRLVVADACNLTAWTEPGRDRGLTDCVQPVFAVDLPETGDALFNGPWGYRAQYWVDPWQGLAANGILLRALATKLLGSVDVEAKPDFARLDVCSSLNAASAKIWIREAPSLLVNAPQGIDVEPWSREAKRGVELAQWGVAAPQVTKFEVKGALLDAYGNEVVPVRKTRRHYDIHNYGFT